MVGVSASVNLPLHHKVQMFSSGTGSPGWSRKKGCKTVVVVVVVLSSFGAVFNRTLPFCDLHFYLSLSFILSLYATLGLQCFDIAGWVAGRASSL